MFRSGKWVMVLVAALMALTLGTQGLVYWARPREAPEKDKAMAFIENVIGIDLEAYDTTSFIFGEYGARRARIAGKYPGHLRSEVEFVLTSKGGSKIKGRIEFIDGTLVSYYTPSRRVKESMPILRVGYTGSPLKITKGLLQRYRDHLNVSYCERLLPLLDEVDLSRNETVESEDAVLRVRVWSDGDINFRWHFKVDGIEASYNGLGFSIKKEGVVSSFHDYWGVSKIGSTAVRVSKEEAIDIALNVTREYLKKLGYGSKVANLILRHSTVEATLSLWNDVWYDNDYTGRGDCLTLYPQWTITIEFDKAYRPSRYTDGYYVAIWADTGEVRRALPQGHYGLSTPQAPPPDVQQADD